MEYSKIIGIYDDEQKLYTSIDQIQEKGYKVADVVSPFPLEELIEKLGVKTRINIAAFFYALIGGVIGISAFLYYTAVIDYPMNIGGKPSLSLTFVL
ncbi:MAG: quinol:electron acceptor oxidoreductase subunit ActD, partial [Bacteroidota bacterium]|nr:quinol:electron acceptor oxidoreductase subunit ActD [Bacteroidota bacterium]